jgi:ATP-dependent RNA helicase RhlB
VKNLAWEYTRDAKEITIESETVTVEEIDQILLHVSSDCKMKLLLGILKNESPESVIIFCNTKRSCEVVAKRLQMNSLNAEFIIGDLPQSKRLDVLNNFKSGKLKILVATDVAARGIDVNDLAMVINYDLPNESENYVHRIGRTARAGKTGKAYTFCSEQDVYNLPAIERYIDMQIPSSMAGEEMMTTDLSEGKYIKCDDYGYDQDDSHNRRRNEKHSRHNDKHDKKDRRNFDKSGKKSDKKDSRYKNKKTAFNEDELANLSFEDRMKMYKEKYGKNTNQENVKSASKKTSETNNKQNPAQKTGKKNTQKDNQKNSKEQIKKPELKKGLSSLSFWERLKLLFKK